MDKFTFEIKGLSNVLGLFGKLPKNIEREIKGELNETANKIASEAKRDAPVFDGRLKNSISVRKNSEISYSVVAQSVQAPWMEFGTKSNAVIPAGLESEAAKFRGVKGQGGDPIANLTEWVRRKQIAGTYSTKTRRRTGGKSTQEQQNKQVAFLIWRKIKRYGIKPQPFFYKQLKPAGAQLIQRLKTILSSIKSK